MVQRYRPKRRIMREFEIEELSAVDRPAQGHAKMTIMKRDGVTKVQRTTGVADGHSHTYDDGEDGTTSVDDGHSHPVTVSGGTVTIGAADGHSHDPADANKGMDTGVGVICSEVEAMDFDSVLAEDEAREAARAVMSDLTDKWIALQHSFDTIAHDSDVSPQDKITRMQESLQQFTESAAKESALIAEAVTKTLSDIPALAGLFPAGGDTGSGVSNKGDTDMAGDAKKQLDELQKQVTDLTEKLEAVTEASEDAQKAAELQDELKGAQAKVEELSEQLSAAEVAKVEAVAKASFTEAERDYFDGLESDAAKKFLEMSTSDRAKALAKSLDDDESIDVGGRLIRKSVVGDDQFAVIKDQQDRIAKQDAEITKERERRETAEFTKRADEELAHLPGEIEDKVGVLKAIDRMDEGTQAALDTMLKAGDKAISAAFEKIGHGGGKSRPGGPDAQEFEKRVAEIAARDKCSGTDALSKARVAYPDEFEAYQQSGN